VTTTSDAAAPASRPARRALDPDALAALEEQRDFLLRSLDDLEREHEAGDVDRSDYETLRDDYTARAARTIRAIESHHARMAARRSSRPRRSWTRLAATVAGVVVFAVLAGVLVAQASGRRESGEALTGDIRTSTRTQLLEATRAVQEGRLDDAIAIYDDLLADQPGNAEALASKGWLQFQSGDPAGIDTLAAAVEADPDYPTTHFFLAFILAQAGRGEAAAEELERFESLDPPAEDMAMVDQSGLREQIEELLAAPSTTTSTATSTAPTSP
jgi:tetratricopeptide (TPR) repeat protein